MARISPESAVRLTQNYVVEHTPSLVPGEPYHADDLASYRRLYSKVVGSAELLGGRSIFHKVWEIDGRPVLAASNRPIPENSNNLTDWKVDVGILVHGDVISNSPGDSRDTYVENGFIHGPGAGDMKWAAIPAIAALTEAPDDVNIAFIMYTNEERGGGDVVHLIENGFKPNMVLCVDGAPIPENEGLISVVPEAKGMKRTRMEILGREPVHSGRLREAQQPLIPFEMARYLTELEQRGGPGIQDPTTAAWEDATFNVNLQSGDFSNATPVDGWMTIETRAGTEEKITQAVELLDDLAQRHGFSFDVYEQFDIFSQSMEDPTVQQFVESAQHAAGVENVVFRKDDGSNDLRHFPQSIPRILTGIRSDNWHSGDSRERVSVGAILTYVEAYTDFIKKVRV